MKAAQCDFLYLIWKDPRTRRNFIVGKLTREKSFKFQYCEEYENARKHGWKMLEAFPEEKIYESAILFPTFSSRLPDPKRRDIDKILNKYGLNQYDAFELLKKNGGRLPIDTYEFISPIFPDDKIVQREFFIMGIRHLATCKGENCSRLPKINVGDFLRIDPEPENITDPFAIQINTQQGEHLGYIPRYYSRAIFERISSGLTYSCQVIEVNRQGVCSECVKVCFNIPSIETPLM